MKESEQRDGKQDLDSLPQRLSPATNTMYKAFLWEPRMKLMEGTKICPLGCKRKRASGENLDVGSKAERVKGEIPMVRTLSFH